MYCIIICETLMIFLYIHNVTMFCQKDELLHSHLTLEPEED